MAHRQHKKPKLEAAKAKQNNLVDMSLPAAETLDMDVVTKRPGFGSLNGEQTAGH